MTTNGGIEYRMEKVVATTPEKASVKEMTLKATGLFGITLLALTACGGDEDASADAEQADTEQPDTETESGDEIEAADEATEEPTEEEGPDAPDIAEIEDAMWDSSLNQESVTISAEMPMDSVAAASEGTEGTEGSEDSEEAAGTIQLGISGDMEGDGYAYTINESLGDFRVFLDQSLQSIDSVIEEYEEVQGEEQGPSPEELREQLEPEGEWVDITSLAPALETPREFIENFRSSMLSSAGVEDLSEWDAETETDTHEGQDVWVYSSENDGATVEFVVLADEDEPLLMQVNSEAEGQETVVTFSDWNEVDEVERPEGDVIISEEDFLVIAESIM